MTVAVQTPKDDHPHPGAAMNQYKNILNSVNVSVYNGIAPAGHRGPRGAGTPTREDTHATRHHQGSAG
jgi:hypothetical protein